MFLFLYETGTPADLIDLSDRGRLFQEFQKIGELYDFDVRVSFQREKMTITGDEDIGSGRPWPLEVG